MDVLTENRFWGLGWLTSGCLILFLSCQHKPAEPLFDGNGRYQYGMYSSEAECRRLNPNPEISCYQWVQFYPDGQADVLMGGDIVESAGYQRNGQTLMVILRYGLPKTLTFTIKSATELIRDNGTVWQRH